MRKILLWAFLLQLLVVFAGCSFEKTEDDWVRELSDRRTRDGAMLYVQEHKTQKAVPVLLRLMEKRYGTIPAIYSLGIIGDPVAVPRLVEELKKVATKDSMDHDRMTEQICMSLGMIGDKAAVEALLWAAEKAGEMGRAGAVQALGMIGDLRAEPKLIQLVEKESEKLLIRHYATIALGEIKAEKAGDTLAYALFVDDETGRNLFRDAQLSMIQIANQNVIDALIKLYDLKNEKANKLAEKIKLKPEWIQIKAINVMGQMRDKRLVPKMLEEFDKGLKDKIVYELFAKVIQSMGVAAQPETEEALVKSFLNRPRSTEYLNEKEIIANALISIGSSKHLDEIMKVAEKGDLRLKNARGKMQEFSQYCLAAANVVSILGDGSYVESFDKFLADGKCKAKIYGMKQETPELLKDFSMRLKASKDCGTDNACWVKKLTAKHWAEREKALYVLAETGDVKKYGKAVLSTMDFPNERVREAIVYYAWKMISKDMIPHYYMMWQAQKLNKEFQKATENLGYVLAIHMRDMKLANKEGEKWIKEQIDHIKIFKKDKKSKAATAVKDAATTKAEGEKKAK